MGRSVCPVIANLYVEDFKQQALASDLARLRSGGFVDDTSWS